MTLRKKLILFSAIGTLTNVILTFAFATWLQRSVTDTIRTLEYQELFRNADRVSNTLSTSLNTIQSHLKLVAQHPNIRDIENQQNCNEALLNAHNALRIPITNIARVAPDGTHACSSKSRESLGSDLKIFPYIGTILENQQPVFSGVSYSESADVYFFAIHEPVFSEEGEFLGTVGASVNMGLLNEEYLLTQIASSEASEVLVVDDSRKVIFSTDPARIGENADPKSSAGLESTEQSLEIIGNQLRVIARETGASESKGITSQIPLPYKSQFLITFAAMISAIGIGVQGVILGIVIVSILKPLDQINSIIAARSKGINQLINDSIAETSNEIGRVAKAYNEMIKKTNNIQEELEQEVIQRTQELEKTKRELEKKVASQTKELQIEKNNLEKKVADRTAKLESTVRDLESMNKSLMGRENKMIELKQEIEELKEELADKDS